jgi:methionine sulfoxide reductase heme-binding subunit
MTAMAAARPRPVRKRALWRDPQGRVSPLKTATLALLFLPGLVLAVQWGGQMLGPRPITEVIHGAGLWTIRLLFITLAISPLASMLEWPRLLLVRRMVGVACACYGGAHLTLYALDQNWNLVGVVSEIALRFYLTIGFVALLGLAALAITSTDSWMRRLRRNWSRLHMLIYPITILAVWHFALQLKHNVSEAVFMAGLAVWLLGWRLVPRAWRRRVVTSLGLAIIAGPIAALLEGGWYWVVNGTHPMLLISANFNARLGLRPAVWAEIVLLAVTILLALRRLSRRRRQLAPA